MIEKLRWFIGRLSPPQGKWLTFLAILLIVAAIPLTVIIALRQQELRQRASESPITPPTDTVSFDLVPATQETVRNQPFTVDVYLNAGTNSVSGVDFTLSLPQDNLTLTEFKSSNVFANILVNEIKDEITSVTFHHAAGILGTIGVTGRAKVGTLSFYPEKVGVATAFFTGVLVTGIGKLEPLPNANNTTGMYTIAEPVIPKPTSTPRPPLLTLTPAPTPIACRTPVNSCRADINRNGPVTVNDWTVLARCQGQAPAGPCTYGDYNGNGTIDQEDLACLQEKYNTLCADINIPTPDGVVNILDFSTFADAFKRGTNGEYIKNADLNNDGKVDLVDFEILRNVFNRTLSEDVLPTP